MEAALRHMLQTSFGEYVEGLDKAQGASFPLVLKDLKLKEQKIQEELDEGDGNFPFDITSGKVGSITVSPGWMGTVEVTASNIVLNFAFAPMKAMNKAMNRKNEDEDEEDDEPVPQHRLQGMPMQQMQQRGPPPAPAAPVPPRYCTMHGTSEQRVKIEPRMVECASCHTTVQTNYSEFTLCPACSEREQRCMLCGKDAPNAGNYMPAMTATAQTTSEPAPVYNAVTRQASASQRGRDSFGQNGPSRLSSQAGPSRQQSAGSVLPTPPPAGPPRTPSNVRAEWDWLGNQGAAPPPPPPPAPSARSSFAPSAAGGTRQAPSGGLPPQFSTRAVPGASPTQTNRERQQMPASMQTSRAQQDKSSVNSLMGYFQNWQIPSLDIGSWANCMNANEMRSSYNTETEAPAASAGAQPWRGGA